MAKLKLALYWAASCGGCEIAILDTNEHVLELAAIADLVLWPFALDYKYHHLEALPDRSIDITLFNGAVRNSEQERLARVLRDKSRVMAAFGSCACFGGIPSLANLHNAQEILQLVYQETTSTDDSYGTIPQIRTKVREGELELPEFYDLVFALDQVVTVEYFIPGCPPTTEQVLRVVEALKTGVWPPHGSVFASEKTLCDECERIKDKKKISHLYRFHEIIPDSKRCFLEQGLVCSGPATRGGCGNRCLKANAPCRGCFGPPPGIIDQGAKMLSAVASIYAAIEPEEITRLLNEVADPSGTFYRFSMSKSLLRSKRQVPVGAAAK